MQRSSNLHIGFQSQEAQVFDTRPAPLHAPTLGKVRGCQGLAWHHGLRLQELMACPPHLASAVLGAASAMQAPSGRYNGGSSFARDAHSRNASLAHPPAHNRATFSSGGDSFARIVAASSRRATGYGLPQAPFLGKSSSTCLQAHAREPVQVGSCLMQSR